MDWASILDPSLPVAELVVQGSLLFLGLTFILRLTGQRESGSLALTDLLVVVLLAEAVSHAFAPDSTSVTDGLILVVTILAWSVVLDAVAYKFPSVRKILKPSKRSLIENGQLNKHLMRREFMGREEIEAQLRLQGIENLDQVKYAFMEPNGMISTFRKDGGEADPTPQPPAS
ncbi:DUF421 domain-containing protein [Crystallibacter degradans]|uniref:DUF421 domain-containing protein n=1 Tax=Crystallibacter degradans TaxID=2726743 RepID=UPI001472DBDB|nr:YetF domain-containing protein [Arthrobacter sp. SF27]NMR28755.1 DUF421 domain-containing protein [Arthrobacter sp. SF27]